MRDDATGSSVRVGDSDDFTDEVGLFRCCQAPGIRAVHGLCTVRWPRSMQVLLIYTCGLPKKLPRPRRIVPRSPVHQLNSRPATTLSRSVLSRRLCAKPFSPALLE